MESDGIGQTDRLAAVIQSWTEWIMRKRGGGGGVGGKEFKPTSKQIKDLHS